tara:strand:- start:1702 stop:3417 length:1716 start_codon:yes stop_codon:yes gene_type:complete
MGTVLKSGTTLAIRIEPKETLTDYPLSDENELVSANLPIIIQMEWSGTGVTGTYKPQAEGDLVNVILEIYMGNKFGVNQNFSATYDMLKIAEISKSRDLPFQFQDTGKFATQTANRQFFSFDIQSICADLLSYTLAPIKQGTIASFGGAFGGYNGEVSSYLQGNAQPYMNSLGAFRFISFKAKAQVLDSNGELTIADTTVSSGTIKYYEGKSIGIINAVPQWTDIHRLNLYTISGKDGTANTNQKFLSYCPNATSSGTPSYKKPVRLAHQAEWLHFYLFRGKFDGSASNDNDTTSVKILITTTESDGTSHTANLTNFNNLITDESGNNIITTAEDAIYRTYCIQNVSPAFINTVSASTITSETISYTAQLIMNDGSDYAISEVRHYVLDKQPTKFAYGFVRFHWLNRLGGIDSYTCTRDVVESISVSKNTYEQRPNQRMFIEEDITPPIYGNAGTSNTNKVDTNFSETYQESVRVLNVDATKNDSVYTEPMNKVEADWLSELITSPSVWIELENDASTRANSVSSSMHPSTLGYFPVIITNSSVETVNQEQGLVKFNIEYTHSHKINTQRN